MKCSHLKNGVVASVTQGPCAQARGAQPVAIVTNRIGFGLLNCSESKMNGVIFVHSRKSDSVDMQFQPFVGCLLDTCLYTSAPARGSPLDGSNVMRSMAALLLVDRAAILDF